MQEEATIEKYQPQVREVLVWPDERLTMPCVDVKDFDDELEKLVADLFVTMTVREGIGLAAPQIGINKNLFVIRIETSKPMVFINPVITTLNKDKEQFEWEEGCLSVPGHFEKRKRPKNIVVNFQDVKGEEHSMQFSGLYAFAIQHEYDHLQGVCFVDGGSMFKRGRVKMKIKKALPKLLARAEEIRKQVNL